MNIKMNVLGTNTLGLNVGTIQITVNGKVIKVDCYHNLTNKYVIGGFINANNGEAVQVNVDGDTGAFYHNNESDIELVYDLEAFKANCDVYDQYYKPHP